MKDNIILVTVDSFRADHCGYIGYESETTPTLDKIANNGTAFSNAVSPGPRTPESMPVIFTGRFLPDDLPTSMVPQQSFIQRHMGASYTIAQQMSDLGYETIGITPNPFTSRYFGFDKGFDHFIDFLGHGDTTVYERLFEGWLGGNSLSNVMRLARNMALKEEVFKPWEALYNEIEQQIQEVSEPYFLWIFPMDVHEPYIAGDGYHSITAAQRWKAIWRLYLGDKETPFSKKTTQRLLSAYDDSIRYTDELFRRLEEDFCSAGHETTMVIHGDHGEAFGEHGIYSHEPYLHEENIHVPLVVSKDLGIDASQPISLKSLPKLIAGIVNGTVEEYLQTHPYGVSKTTKQNKIAIRGRNWKYIQSDTDSSLYKIADGKEQKLVDDELESCAASITSMVREQGREIQRISETIKGISESENI